MDRQSKNDDDDDKHKWNGRGIQDVTVFQGEEEGVTERGMSELAGSFVALLVGWLVGCHCLVIVVHHHHPCHGRVTDVFENVPFPSHWWLR